MKQTMKQITLLYSPLMVKTDIRWNNELNVFGTGITRYEEHFHCQMG
jgi:hypothetical protein